MTLHHIQTLYQYNGWANRRVLDTAARLSVEQLRQPGPASFESIHNTLVHTMAGQWVWLSRWQGSSPKALFTPADFPDLAALRARWAEIEGDTQQFIATLDDTALAQPITYANTKGRQFSFPLWQLMLQQANHATQHRSEIAMLLTGFGHSPGWLDFIKYLTDPDSA